MVFVYDGRASRQDAGCVFYISDELHEWFIQQNPGYHGDVILDFAIKINRNTFEPDIVGFLLSFKDPDLALLFKLAWGGRC